ncbi:type I methionyl aminopeptidase [Desulfovibrio inopinatus]|uniref:type I methionyl aminopeptidase n=1 Tax=Desulfovibrio inopinatus TaxID=102109 RepID=UPI0005545B17|nr:type I methionyl aminopeptidase [Desulfovibrio inopinatus]
MNVYNGIVLKNDSEIEILREANRIVSRILDALGKMIAPGLKTMVFEEEALRLCEEFHVIPAFKGYYGFPYALCCSVNEVVVHGFPSDRVLQVGDLVSFDMGVIYKEFYGDSARTFAVGTVSAEAKKLVDVARMSLMQGIREAREGNGLFSISRAVQNVVEKHGFSVVRRFVGHGIGKKLHERPEIPNFVPSGGADIPLKKGMVLAIEPMVTLGAPDIEILDDKWTAVTKDRSLSAHFEHSVVITKDGPSILSVS